MSSIALNSTLDERVEELERKATRIEQSKNTSRRIDSANRDIGRISSRLDDVASKVDELRYYTRLYERAFGKSQPGNIQPRVRTAIEKVDIDDDELLEAAQDDRLSDLEDQVEEGESKISSAIKAIREALEEEQQSWKTKLDAAQELNEIIGGNSEFQDLIVKMKSFLESEMWNPGREVTQLAAQWERYERKWDENAGKHGWETFQQDHDLADSTVEELKQFGDDEPVRLSDLSLETLEEIKRVPELESALQLEVRS